MKTDQLARVARATDDRANSETATASCCFCRHPCLQRDDMPSVSLVPLQLPLPAAASAAIIARSTGPQISSAALSARCPLRSPLISSALLSSLCSLLFALSPLSSLPSHHVFQQCHGPLRRHVQRLRRRGVLVLGRGPKPQPDKERRLRGPRRRQLVGPGRVPAARDTESGVFGKTAAKTGSFTAWQRKGGSLAAITIAVDA